MRRASALRVLNQPVWTLLVLLGLIGLLVVVPDSLRAQPRSWAMLVRLWTTDEAPVAGAAVHVFDAASDQLIDEGTTDRAGEIRFARLEAAAIRVMVSGTMADGTPLRQVGQDASGIWARLPARNWTMDLRADLDGTVFPDLGSTSAGAVDGHDATAIAGSMPPSAETPMSGTVPSVPLRPVPVVPQHTINPGAPTASALSSGRDVSAGALPGTVLLLVLGGLTIGVALAIWRGKL